MSINLYFKTKTRRKIYVNFPFQTPTSWTFEIYNEPDVEKRCSILKSKMKDNPWLDNELVNECISMLRDPELELTYL